MKKIFSILLSNIILLLCVYEIFSYILHNKFIDDELRKIWQSHVKVDISDIETMDVPNGMKIVPLTEKSIMQYCGERREVINENFKKEPIIFMGCSYVYGHGLKKEESFPYLISELKQRPVYNFAYCGGDLVSSTYELFDNLEREHGDRIREAKYIVYIYMHDHINRYILPDKERAYNKYIPCKQKYENLLKKFYLYRNYRFRMKLYNVYKEFPYSNHAKEYLKNLFSNNIKVLKEKIPNAKIIFIIYDEIPIFIDDGGINEQKIRYETDIMESSFWNELEEEEGITVIHTEDLIGFPFGEEYILLEDIAPFHPNAKAWQLLAPPFAEKYLE